MQWFPAQFTAKQNAFLATPCYSAFTRARARASPIRDLTRALWIPTQGIPDPYRPWEAAITRSYWLLLISD